MATWEDGPEYAPLERPAEFTSPAVEPLDVAPPVPQPPAALPSQPPVFDEPPQPVAPLASLVPPPKDGRDPQEPFAVVSSNLTSGSAWGSAHQPVPLAVTAPQHPLGGPAPTPVAPAWPGAASGWPAPAPAWPTPAPGPEPWPPAVAPGQQATGFPPPGPFPAQGQPPGYPPSGPFPAPGTPQWFGPGSYGEQQSAPDRVDARRVLDAVTPGLLIVLAIGGIIAVLAPITLSLAFPLANRVGAAREQVRRTLGVALVALGFFGLVGLTLSPLDFAEWWDFVDGWAQLISWLVLVAVGALVYAALRRAGRPPAPRSDWR